MLFLLPMPALALIRISIAAVWIYEGLWCKLLGRMPSQFAIMIELPGCTAERAVLLLRLLGMVEVFLALWVMSGEASGACALTQAALLLALNANGIFWARHLIHDPAGMVIKNMAFLVLVWVGGAWTGR
jgi:hypothetical protein